MFVYPNNVSGNNFLDMGLETTIKKYLNDTFVRESTDIVCVALTLNTDCPLAAQMQAVM